ncbi:MAG: multidrug effflux MFS transporter [Legionellales bacterium]
MHSDKNMQPQVPKIPILLIVIILLLMILSQTTTDQYLPSLPAITKTFNSTEASIQLTLSLFMLGLGFSHLFYGPMSDWVGRKPPLLAGIGISIVGSLCCYLAPSVSWLIVGRFLQGFGIGCCGSVGRSLVRDLFSDRLLAQIGSYVAVVSIFTMASSPMLGGYIQELYGWRFNFLFLVVFGIFVWVLILLLLPETNKHKNPDAIKIGVMAKNYSNMLRSKVFLGYTLCSCFAMAGIVSYFTIAPFLFQNHLGLSPVQFGQLSFFVAGAVCFSGIINSQMVMKKGISYMLGIGILFMVTGGLSMLFLCVMGLASILSIMLPVFLFSMGVGFTFMNAYAGAFHPFPKMAGTVGALYSSMQDFSASGISGLIAGFKIYGELSLAILFVTLSFGSLMSWYFLTYKVGLKNQEE